MSNKYYATTWFSKLRSLDPAKLRWCPYIDGVLCWEKPTEKGCCEECPMKKATNEEDEEAKMNSDLYNHT